ncbi:MAG: hypothetical protein J6S94_00340 [Bacteroidaceae bacterium]|nr:hypothetical protein [Bacteroidaceae bacterium]
MDRRALTRDEALELVRRYKRIISARFAVVSTWYPILSQMSVFPSLTEEQIRHLRSMGMAFGNEDDAKSCITNTPKIKKSGGAT